METDQNVSECVQTYLVTVVGPFRPPPENVAAAINEDYFNKLTVTVTAVGGDTATVEPKRRG